MSLPIKSRLTIWYIVLLAIILVAWSTFLLIRLKADLYAGIDQALDVRAAQISLSTKGPGEGEFQDISESSLAQITKGEYVAQLLSANGMVLEASGDVPSKKPMIPAATISRILNGHHIRDTVTLGKDSERFRVLAVELLKTSNPEIIVVGTSTEDVDNSIDRLLVLLLISVPAALVLAGIGGWLLARKALLPVVQITSKAAEIGVSQLDERIEVPIKTDELGKLAVTLNRMLDRLQHGVEEKRRFIADASHEMRTPLAIMRSEIDVSLSLDNLQPEAIETLKSTRDEVDRMSRIVENMLTLARIDEGRLPLLKKPVDIADLARTVAQNMGSLADAKNMSVEVTGESEFVIADPEYLEQVIVNLVENAVKYSQPGGSVTLSVWQSEGEAGITVSDNGPGIPEELLGKVFERFFRVDTSRSRTLGGSGLGLSISEDIIKAHSGRIWATSELGHGSTFTIALRQMPGDTGALDPSDTGKQDNEAKRPRPFAGAF